MAHSHLEGGTGMQMVCSGRLNMPVRIFGNSSFGVSTSANLTRSVSITGGGGAALYTRRTSALNMKTAISGTGAFALTAIVHKITGTSRNNKEGTTAITFTGVGNLTGTTGVP